MPDLTIQDLLDHLPDFFVAERAANIQAAIQFDISGEQGGQWIVKFEDGVCRTFIGKDESADLKFLGSGADVLDIFYGRINPMTALMQGRIQLKGNMNLALRLFDLFDLDKGKLDQIRSK